MESLNSAQLSACPNVRISCCSLTNLLFPVLLFHPHSHVTHSPCTASSFRPSNYPPLQINTLLSSLTTHQGARIKGRHKIWHLFNHLQHLCSSATIVNRNYATIITWRPYLILELWWSRNFWHNLHVICNLTIFCKFLLSLSPSLARSEIKLQFRPRRRNI